MFVAPALEDLVGAGGADGVNVVDIYLLPAVVAHTPSPPHVVDVGWTRPLSLPASCGVGHSQDVTEYVHRDLVYVYDMANDGQRGFRRVVKGEAWGTRTYAVASYEEAVPPHAFPSTKEITHRAEVRRVAYRLHHRLQLVHEPACAANGDRHTYVLRYTHADNVDVKKVAQEVRTVMRGLRAP